MRLLMGGAGNEAERHREAEQELEVTGIKQGKERAGACIVPNMEF